MAQSARTGTNRAFDVGAPLSIRVIFHRILELGLLGVLVSCAPAPQVMVEKATPQTTTTGAIERQSPAELTTGGNARGPKPRGSLYDESTPSIDATVNQEFSIVLPDNVSLPRKWRIEPALDGSMLELMSAVYADQPPEGCSSCVGYGGTRAFRFKTTRPGTSTVRFVYGPLGGAATSADKQVTFTVRIAE
jgi:predicted secreted protein